MLLFFFRQQNTTSFSQRLYYNIIKLNPNSLHLKGRIDYEKHPNRHFYRCRSILRFPR